MTHARCIHTQHTHETCTYTLDAHTTTHARCTHYEHTHIHTHNARRTRRMHNSRTTHACTYNAHMTRIQDMWYSRNTTHAHMTHDAHTHTMHARHMRDAHTMHDVHTHTHDARMTLGHTIHGTSISTLNAFMSFFFCSHHVVKFQDSPTYCVTYTLIYDIFYEKSSNYSLVLFTSYYEISKFTHLLANLNTYLCHIT